MAKVNGTSPYPVLKRPATADHLKRKPKLWRIVEIHEDQGAVQALAAAEKELGEAELVALPNGPDREARAAERRARIEESKKAVEAAREAVDETSRQLLLVGVGREAKRLIEDANPPTDEDIKTARDNGMPVPDYDPTKVARALIAASLHQPKMTEDELDDAIGEWSDGEYLTLWMATLEVNNDSSLVSWGKGSRGANGIARK